MRGISIMIGKKDDESARWSTLLARVLQLTRDYASYRALAVIKDVHLKEAQADACAARTEAEVANLRCETLEREKAEQVGRIGILDTLLRETIRCEQSLERRLGAKIEEITGLTAAKMAAETRAKTAEVENTELRREVKQWFAISLVLMICLGLPLALFAFGLVPPLIGGEPELSDAQMAQIERMVSNTEVKLDPQSADELNDIASRMEAAAARAEAAAMLRQGELPFLPEPPRMPMGSSDYLEDYDFRDSPLSLVVLVDPAKQHIDYNWYDGHWAGSIDYRYSETLIFPDGNIAAGSYYVAELRFGADGKIARVILSADPVSETIVRPE